MHIEKINPLSYLMCYARHLAAKFFFNFSTFYMTSKRTKFFWIHMISKWAYNYLTERLSCARVLPSVSATLLYCLANGAGVRNVVIYEKVSSYLRWIWCPFSGKMTFFEGKSV